MWSMFREGGWGMIPTLVLGLVMIAFAFRYATKPDPRLFAPLASLGIVTLLMGSLASVTGIMKSLAAFGGPVRIALCGVAESLNNLALALALLLVATLLVCVGAIRAIGLGDARDAVT